jgi:hypothetical protein
MKRGRSTGGHPTTAEDNDVAAVAVPSLPFRARISESRRMKRSPLGLSYSAPQRTRARLGPSFSAGAGVDAGSAVPGLALVWALTSLLLAVCTCVFKVRVVLYIREVRIVLICTVVIHNAIST